MTKPENIKLLEILCYAKEKILEEIKLQEENEGEISSNSVMLYNNIKEEIKNLKDNLK